MALTVFPDVSLLALKMSNVMLLPVVSCINSKLNVQEPESENLKWYLSYLKSYMEQCQFHCSGQENPWPMLSGIQN